MNIGIFRNLNDILHQYKYEEKENNISVSINLPKLPYEKSIDILQHQMHIFSSFCKIHIKSNNFFEEYYIEDENEIIDYEDEIKEICVEDNLKYELIINKPNLSKYIYDALSLNNDYIITTVGDNEYLMNHFFYKLELEENIRFCKNNIFVVIKDDILLKNSNIVITNIQHISEELISKMFINDFKNITKRNNICNWNNGTKYLVPDIIYFNDFSNCSNCKMNNYFIKICSDLIMRFICNYSGYENGKFISKINGTKTIDIDYETNKYSLENLNTMYDIYLWVYEEKTESRIIALRNVITTLIAAKCNKHCMKDNYGMILDNSKWILKSVKDNYKIFMESNITEFFKRKDTLMKDTLSQINSVIEKIDKIISNMNTNLIAFMGTIITGVIAYLNNGNILILKVVLVLYIIYLVVISIFFYTQQINKFKTTKKIFYDKYDDYTKKYIEDENIIKVKETFNKNKKQFWAYFCSSITIYIIIIVVIIYSMTSSLLPNILNSNKEKKDIEKQQEQIDSQNNKINELEQYIKELEKKYNEVKSENINNNESNQ